MTRTSRIALALCCLAALAGCGSALENGGNTALTGLDLQNMTALMAHRLAANEQVRAAIQTKGELRVVVEPAENDMEAEILPRGQAELFTSRVRYLLARQNTPGFRWIMNRGEFQRLRGKERDDVLGPAPDAMNPDFALIAHFRSLADENSASRTSAYLCVYELVNLADRTLLWTDRYEVEKRVLKGFLD